MAVSFASVPLLVKKHLRQFAARRDGRDLLRERRLRLVREHGGDVLQRVELRVDFARSPSRCSGRRSP